MSDPIITATKVKGAPSHDPRYLVHFGRVLVGEFFKAEDGYFGFWPDHRPGFWPSWLMRAIADELDKLNKPWNDQINREIM